VLLIEKILVVSFWTKGAHIWAARGGICHPCPPSVTPLVAVVYFYLFIIR